MTNLISPFREATMAPRVVSKGNRAVARARWPGPAGIHGTNEADELALPAAVISVMNVPTVAGTGALAV